MPNHKTIKKILGCWQLYVLILPTLLYLTLFSYKPMYGVILAFKDYKPTLGIWNSQWVGLKHFVRFINGTRFWPVISNTLLLSVYGMIVGFPLPIILALSLNSLHSNKFRRTVQTVTYAPHFVSVIVVVGMMSIMFHPDRGIINLIITALGGTPKFFMGEARYFRAMHIGSGIWSGLGWSSIIYLSALSATDPYLHEAAVIDGASRMKRIRHVDLPTIAPTIGMLLILNMGGLLSVGFTKAFLMQNTVNFPVSEVISTYVYRLGFTDFQYSFSTAVGLFNSIISIALVIMANTISKRVSEVGIW